MIERSLILHLVVDVIVRTALVFSLFLLFTGHNAPGGGFVAGLVAGIALTLRFVALGRRGIGELLPVPPEALMGIGLALAVTTGVLGWWWGDSFLQSTKLSVTAGILGEVKATSALPFDIGVYLVVIGLSAALILALSERDETP